MLTIHLENLRFYAFHGLYNVENEIGNEFELNIYISFNESSEIVSDINGTINYADIYYLVKEEMAKPRKLLETFITEVAKKIRALYPQVLKIKISIYKITAPIEGFDGKVGATLERFW